MNIKDNKKSDRAKTPGETKRGSHNSGAKRREYGITDMTEKVIELRGNDITRDWNRTRDFVTECCESLGRLWQMEPLVEFIKDEVLFNRVVEIIVQLSPENDPKVKRVINKINNNKKPIKKEESKKFNKFAEEVLKKDKSKEEQEIIANRYKKKDDALYKIIEIKEEMKDKFCKLYDRYIDEMLNQEFKVYRNKTEEHLEEIVNTNNEILVLIDAKINKFLYTNEIIKITCEIFEAEENGKKIDINQIEEKIREAGKLYGADIRKDIEALIDLKKSYI